VRTGNVDVRYQLPENRNRGVRFDPKDRRPEDSTYQDPKSRIPAQTHY